MANQVRPGIDNFRSFYIVLDDTYELPGITTTGISAEQKDELFAVLKRVHPPFADGFHILPNNRPARFATELHLGKSLSHGGQDFVLVLRILAEYRGGASSEEVVAQAGGEKTPRIRTNKIYYRARIVPCRDLKHAGSALVDFTPHRLPAVESIFTEVKDSEQEGDRVNTFGIFNDPDFKEFNTRVTSLLGDWPHAAVFFPIIADDFLTLSLNLIYPHSYYLETALPRYASTFAALAENGENAAISGEDRDFWGRYFKSIGLERSYSRSGNPHWQFNALPWT